MAAADSDDDQTRSFRALAAGTVVSHYKIISRIGAGGMGEVYLAEDTQLDRKVALKFLPVHLGQDGSARVRFTREAKAAAKLDHPNIVQVFEVSEFQGRPFFAMAHIEGKSLKEVIKEGRLSINEAIEFTKQICEGLHKAHESGVVHRDIKPGNIIIDRDNKARILDFGLATVAGEEKLTKTGSTLGTVGYMSPEQIEGKQVDHRSDLFSVGVIIYEMLTGRRPFEGDTDAAVTRSITDTTPEPIARYKSGTTGELQQVVDKVLQKDPSLRYQHADGLLADLKRLHLVDKSQGRGKRGLLFATAAVIAIAIIGYLITRAYKIKPVPDDDTWSNSVAVLVFRDLSPNEDQGYFCEGMTDEIIGRLSTINDLKVTSMQSMLRFKGTDLDLKAIGEELGVANILEGSVQKSGDRIRVRTQLVRVDDDAHIWTERYDRELSDVFAIQDEISLAIGEVLEARLLGGKEVFASRRGTDNLEAYNNYLQGRYFWRKRSADGMVKALKFFKRAVEIDPSFALAWSGLADTYTLQRGFMQEPDPEAYLKAIEAAQTAIDLDGNLAEAHASLGYAFYRSGNTAGGLEELKRSLELNPNYVWGQLWYGVVMGREMRRKDLFLQHSIRALELDPLNVSALQGVATVLYDSGLYEQAEVYFTKMIDIVPENTVYRLWLAWNQQRAGQDAQAEEQFEKAIEIDPDYWDLYFWWGQALVEAGRDSAAIAMFEESIDAMPDSAGIYYAYGRCLQYLMGNTEKAITELSRAVVLNPQFDQAYEVLAFSYIANGEGEKAMEAIDKACELSPVSLDYVRSRGEICWRLGALKKAIASYRQVLGWNPYRMDALVGLGNAAMFDRQYDLADSVYRVCASNVSLEQKGWGQFYLTRTLRHQGKFRETVSRMILSERVIRQELGASDQLGGLYWNRAQMYWEWLKEYDKALEDLDSLELLGNRIDNTGAISSAELGRPLVYALAGKYDSCDYYWQKVDPGTSKLNLYRWQAYIQLAEGYADSAVTYLELSRSIGPSNAIDNGWLGLAYLENGQTAKAVKHLEQAVFRYDGIKGVFPGYAVWFRYHLARAYEAAGRKSEAIDQYETFLDIWKNADEGLESVIDARRRLSSLKKSI